MNLCKQSIMYVIFLFVFFFQKKFFEFLITYSIQKAKANNKCFRELEELEQNLRKFQLPCAIALIPDHETVSVAEYLPKSVAEIAKLMEVDIPGLQRTSYFLAAA